MGIRHSLLPLGVIELKAPRGMSDCENPTFPKPLHRENFQAPHSSADISRKDILSLAARSKPRAQLSGSAPATGIQGLLSSKPALFEDAGIFLALGSTDAGNKCQPITGLQGRGRRLFHTLGCVTDTRVMQD